MTTFLSYHHADEIAAAALAGGLRQAGLDVFWDKTELHAGDRWLQRLEQAVERCDAFVVLVGRDDIRRWMAAEVEAALNRHFGPLDDAQRLPIHPVLLPEVSPESMAPFLRLFQSEHWTPNDAPPSDLVQALNARQARPNARPLIDPDRCPYLGLASFGADDAMLFFGRRAETLAALRSLGDQKDGDPNKPLATGPAHTRWLQVEGYSGSGKSSLVKAGLLPMLRQGGALWPRTRLEQVRILGPLLPGQQPVKQLAVALEHERAGTEAHRDSLGQMQRLLSDPRALAMQLLDMRRPSTAFVLLVDQFEELFTLADANERAHFDALLATALADDDCALYLISTVRSDFIDRMGLLPRLSVLLNTRCQRWLMPPIGEPGLREAIEGPARLAGLDVSEVTTALLAEARNEPGALPLVENALMLLWQQREASPHGPHLSGRLLEACGGAAGMLSASADDLLARITQAHGQPGRAGALELLLRLTRINTDDRLRHSRQRVPRDEALAAAGQVDAVCGEQVLRLLSGQAPQGRPRDAALGHLRLLTTGADHDAAGEHPWVDLIHETLLRARPPAQPGQSPRPYWPTLYEHIDANRDRDVLRQQLRLQRERWASDGRLTRWRQLAGWVQWFALRKQRLPPGSADARFLRHSMRVLAGQAAVALVVLGALGHGAWWASTNNLPLGYAFVEVGWMLGWEPQPEAVPLPPGRFTMGCTPGRDVDIATECEISPVSQILGGLGPMREIHIDRPCAISRTPVTFLEFDRFVWSLGRQRLYPVDAGWGRFDHPAINVSWYDAQAYVEWLSQTTGQTWQLPTEAEWEYAARGGLEARYPWGDAPAIGRANCSDCGPNATDRTTPVRMYLPNAFGLYDMAGNVWQWVDSKVEPSNLIPEARRVLRGSPWDGNTFHLRAGYSAHAGPDQKRANIGFRVCRVAPNEKPSAGALEAGPLKR